MKCLRIVSFAALAGKLACGADGAEARTKATSSESTPAIATSARPSPPPVRLPSVLRSPEAKDSRIVLLPGPVVPKQAPAPVLVAPGWRPKGVPSLPPAPDAVLMRATTKADNLHALVSAAPAPRFPAPDPVPVAAIPESPEGPSPSSEMPPAAQPAPTDVETAPIDLAPLPDVLRARPGTLLPPEPRKPAYEADMARESAVFCQREIGRWTLADARTVLGEPRRQRAAIDDDALIDGRIYAFRDPTNRYRELELDFGKENGILRTVFVYPWNLTWLDCRKLWGAQVSATEGNRGRVFYSYVNRHLDVLVDHQGKVISLGLY